MSEPKKLRGGGNSELTRLKACWRGLSEDARDFWRALFGGEQTQAQVRQLIATKLKIKLNWDKQLTQFRAWLEYQDALDAEEERMAEDERRLLESGENLTKEQIREKVLAKSYARSLATGDFKQGLATVKVDLKAEEVKLDRDKFEFDAAVAALKHASELKTISSNTKLSETEKVNLARQKLFGVVPEAK